MARIWLRACHPVPMIPTDPASGRAMYLVATALAAPVRICPSRLASIIASSSPVSVL